MLKVAGKELTEAGAGMGMDFSTQEKLDDVEVFRLDDLTQQEVVVRDETRKAKSESWLSLLLYWIREIRWRMRYWNQSRD
jgi:hypothetical protein